MGQFTYSENYSKTRDVYLQQHGLMQVRIRDQLGVQRLALVTAPKEKQLFDDARKLGGTTQNKVERVIT